MKLTWDETKARSNRAKHGVSFEEASELFQGEVDDLEIYDREHSDEEDRFIAIGPIKQGMVVGRLRRAGGGCDQDDQRSACYGAGD